MSKELEDEEFTAHELANVAEPLRDSVWTAIRLELLLVLKRVRDRRRIVGKTLALKVLMTYQNQHASSGLTMPSLDDFCGDFSICASAGEARLSGCRPFCAHRCLPGHSYGSMAQFAPYTDREQNKPRRNSVARLHKTGLYRCICPLILATASCPVHLPLLSLHIPVVYFYALPNIMTHDCLRRPTKPRQRWPHKTSYTPKWTKWEFSPLELDRAADDVVRKIVDAAGMSTTTTTWAQMDDLDVEHKASTHKEDGVEWRVVDADFRMVQDAKDFFSLRSLVLSFFFCIDL
ncbi:hypothetical protein C8J57DRAFT_1729092 [Mycena rebaudengoi]|nr:hypothetical protein C8J57DRAFT_1729092 [Mycena rebaudengoi]